MEYKYRYREVRCPYCGHVFMWNRSCREATVDHLYKLKETGERVGEAKCPKCGTGMLVLNGTLEGLPTTDERVETVGIRGI